MRAVKLTVIVGLLIAVSSLSTPSSGLETGSGIWAVSHSDPTYSSFVPRQLYSRTGTGGGAGTLTVVSALPSWRMLCRLTSLVVHDDVMLQPLELELSIGAKTFLRTVRRAIRRFFKMVVWSVKQWMSWTLQAVALVLVAAAATLLDRELVKTWREQGFMALRVSISLALAVYVRLLLDRRAPMIGKGMLAFAIIYGIADRDLVPDGLVPIGFIDDLVAIALASRCFMWTCPDRLVDAHAAQAARVRDRSLRRRASRRRITRAEYSLER